MYRKESCSKPYGCTNNIGTSMGCGSNKKTELRCIDSGPGYHYSSTGKIIRENNGKLCSKKVFSGFTQVSPYPSDSKNISQNVKWDSPYNGACEQRCVLINGEYIQQPWGCGVNVANNQYGNGIRFS